MSWRMSVKPSLSATETTALLAESKEGNSSASANVTTRSADSAEMTRSYNDETRHTTFSRRVARFLARHTWYYPHVTAREEYEKAKATDGAVLPPMKPPSLDAAWAYFEHVTLPRHFLPEEGDKRGKDTLQKAEPGEASAETRLYSVWGTPETDLADFGIGVGIYFFTLRTLAFILLFAGIINIPNLMYYNSDAYNHDEQGGVPHVLQRSAICTDYKWAACPDCTGDQWDYFPRTFDRYAESADGSLKFLKVNLCSFGYFLGLFNWISIVFVSVALYILCFHVIKRREIKFDEASQTTTDYSVAVENPPKDAGDANEWKEFFSQFGHVTCCTVAVDNEELVRALVQRRGLMFALQQQLPEGVEFDKFNLDKAVEDALPLLWWQKLTLSSDAQQIRSQIATLDEKIFELSENKYDVSEIFITFETEQAQRRALTALSVRRLDTLTHSTSALPETLLFSGKHLLKIKEPPEPSAVRWQDLDESFKVRVAQRLGTSTITIAGIVCSMIFITYCRFKYGPGTAALVIAAMNTIAPMFCAYVTEIESHPSEGSKQSSRYFKTTACLWINTAIVTSLVTPFPDTVSNDKESILYSLYAIYIFELIRGPITQLLDIAGNIKRHLLGPRVLNALRLASLFQGTFYELSERYTNMTNVVFLTFYYGTIFPAGYFFAALTLAVHYWTDKYCLLRIWSPAPLMGTRISTVCRSFLAFSLLVLALTSSYYVAGFPFDNACEGSKVSSQYVGDFTVIVQNGEEVSVSISEEENSFFFCDMDMMRYRPWPAFPAWPSNQPPGGEWMDKDQENITLLFGWTSVFALVLIALVVLNRVVLKLIRNLFFPSYKPSGEASDLGFSDVHEIFSYVPQVRVFGFPFPVLVCNVNEIDRELIGWNDPHFGVNAHNVIYDVPEITDKTGIFSEVKHWPPPGKT